jgi:phage terminase small subunit
MGNKRSGRRRLPTATKTLRGSRVRTPVASEPTFGAPGVPVPPPHLVDDAEALAAYASFGARLVAARVLTPAHGELLAMLAEAWADYVRKRQEFAAEGRKSIVIQSWTDAEGVTRERRIENPLVRQMRQQLDQVARIAGEFGLTPATASKVQRIDAAAADPDEAFFANRPPNVLPFPSAPPPATRPARPAKRRRP